MIDLIAEKIYVKSKKYDISNHRIDDVIKFIKSKIDNEIISYFVTYTTDSYTAVADLDLKSVPIQIDILTSKYLFELWFGETDMKFDKTDINFLGIPEILQSQNKIQLTFGMIIPNRVSIISTIDNTEFKELLEFVNVYEKVIFC